MDKRWLELGEILVNHSAEIKPGERVMIAMTEVETFPLVQGVYRAVIKAGGFPQVQFLSERLRHSLMKYGNEEQINWVPEIEAYGMDWADVYIGLRGANNLFENADISTDVLSKNQRAMGKISSLRWEKTRWCLVRVPNDAFAQQAETDVETIMEMFFNACLIDWKKSTEEWQQISQKLEKGSDIQILGKDTDLRFSVKGRKWIVGDGKINMPDGEIFTAPINETLNGKIYFEFPGVFGGRLIEDIRLYWENGKLVEATSSTEQEYLRKVIATDLGSSLLGEFAFGTNAAVDHFCKDILIDEKIGGTIHIALGRAYPECGGTNQSAIYWDIIKDIRNSGEVLLDGKIVFKEGKFLL